MDLLCYYIDRFFKEINCPVEVITYEDGDSLLKNIDTFKERDVKIAFMDIYMPDVSGIDIAMKIRDAGNDMVIIFTTNSLDHGLDGYSVDALQYLVKPIDYPRMESVLNKCTRLFAQSMRSIEIMANRLTIRVLLKDILYIEVYKNTCLIHTGAETIKSYCPLEEIEKQLDGNTFLRTHRSYIVNMRHVDDVAENDFVLKCGDRVPIRRNSGSAVKQAYRNYLFSQARGM